MATDTDTMILRALLQRFGLPTTLPNGLDPDALLAHMHLDKKAQASGLRFVLWAGLGRARVVADVPEDAVGAGLHATPIQPRSHPSPPYGGRSRERRSGT